MPPEGVLPVCPRVVATARPGREAWAREELWDALAGLPGARVEESGYPGVLLGYAGAPPCRVAREVLAWSYGFTRRIVVVEECAPCGRAGELALRLAARCGGAARLLYRRRGCGPGRGGLEALLRGSGLRVSRRLPVVLALEGLGWGVAGSCGRLRPRPYGVEVVEPLACTL